MLEQLGSIIHSGLGQIICLFSISDFLPAGSADFWKIKWEKLCVSRSFLLLLHITSIPAFQKYLPLHK